MAVKWTDEQLMSLPDTGHKAELVDGRLRMAPAGFEHGDISVALSMALRLHVFRQRLGRVLDSSTGYRMRSQNVRCPDVSFVSKERLRGLKELPKGFFDGSPDLVVEVISPSDTVDEVHTRMAEYFQNDTKLAWVVHPAQKVVWVYRAEGIVGTKREGDFLEGEEVVPGFRLAVSEVFVGLEE